MKQYYYSLKYKQKANLLLEVLLSEMKDLSNPISDEVK